MYKSPHVVKVANQFYTLEEADRYRLRVYAAEAAVYGSMVKNPVLQRVICRKCAGSPIGRGNRLRIYQVWVRVPPSVSF